MKIKLQKISATEAKKYDLAKDVDVMRVIKEAKEPAYFLIESKNGVRPEKTTNQLLEIEIALRKCDRFGFFNK